MANAPPSYGVYREFESHRYYQFCLCVYGYPYVVRESPKTLVYVLEARSKRSRYVQRTTWTLCDDKQIQYVSLM